MFARDQGAGEITWREIKFESGIEGAPRGDGSSSGRCPKLPLRARGGVRRKATRLNRGNTHERRVWAVSYYRGFENAQGQLAPGSPNPPLDWRSPFVFLTVVDIGK